MVVPREVHARQRAGHRHLGYVEGTDDGRPEGLFVAAADLALQVDPEIHVVPGLEAQRAPGNGHLGVPPLFVPGGVYVPHAVPVRQDVGIEASFRTALVAHLGVIAGAVRVGGEENAVLPVHERVQDDLEVVVVRQVAVPRHLGGDDLGGVRVVGPDADVHCLFVIEDPHLGTLGRRLTFVGALLGKAAGRQGVLPYAFVQDAVHVQRFQDAQRDDLPLLRRRRTGGLHGLHSQVGGQQNSEVEGGQGARGCTNTVHRVIPPWPVRTVRTG